ncbi:DMT family transporter [Thiolapillus sp.]|uniref:DMT family transporter n=3 Tax=Thiolapillus sp. TaxID=2017437 RepID=UPI003AF9A7B4
MPQGAALPVRFRKRENYTTMKPLLSLLFAASFWGVVWYPLRLLQDAGLNGAWQMLVAYGSAFSVLAMLRWPGIAGMQGQWGKLALMAVAAGWTNVGFVLAMLDGSVARALILFYISPLWTVLLGHFFLHERLRPATLLTLPLGMMGAILMIWQPQVSMASLNRADLYAASAGLAFAVTNVITRDLQHLGTRQKTLVSWFGVICVAGFMLLLGGEPFPQVALSAWLGNILLGGVGFLVTTLAVIYGISHMPVQRSAVILLFEILVGALSAWWLAGENLRMLEWLGGGLIILAGFIAITHEDIHD